MSKPQKHLTSPLPASCRVQNDTNRKYCSAAGRVAILLMLTRVNQIYENSKIGITLHPPKNGVDFMSVYSITFCQIGADCPKQATFVSFMGKTLQNGKLFHRS